MTNRKPAKNTKPVRRAPPLNYPAELPISSCRRQIVEAIRSRQVVIIAGDTGSGKSTQIPKMCLEAGRGTRRLIGHTQPRRIAAMTIARRLSEELGSPLGGSVGYKIRFDERMGENSSVKVMTDGILLAEIQLDPFLNAYDTIIVDEAHERSLNIDFLLGILRGLLRKRRDLKLIITSATLDTEKFSRAFGGAPVIEVSGRTFPVEVRYRPVNQDQGSGQEESAEATYLDAALRALDEIDRESIRGDVLLFMPTEQDIREMCEVLAGRNKARHGRDTILPLFARLTWAEQRRIFAPSPGRKIVIATNVAETSLTIPGIRYVIDTGLARLAQYNPRTRTLSLPVAEISRSSADQRKGRCGRVSAGICIRLYSREDYESRDLYTKPEILRSNLAEVILRMLSLRIGQIESFPFIDPPEEKHIRNGLELLKELGAVWAPADSPGESRTDSRVRADGAPQEEVGLKTGEARKRITGLTLTPLGRRMARFPTDPRISRMLIEAAHEGCLNEIAVIASALSIQDPREWPMDRIEAARKAHQAFQDPASDFLGYLHLWNRYDEGGNGSQGRLRKFCKTHFLSYRRMREWVDIHHQLCAIISELDLTGPEAAGSPAMGSERKKDPASDQPPYARIHRSILSGYLSNIAVKKEKNIYSAAKGKQVMIFPGSGLFNKAGEWIVSAEVVETTRIYARTAAAIERDWLEPLGKDLCRYHHSDAHWERSRGEVVASEQVTLFGLVIVPRRLVSYGPVDPDEASRIFVRSALVEGDLAKLPRFLAENQKLIERIAGMEDKLRRRDLLVDEEALQEFYRARLPGVYDLRTLQKRIREEGGDSFLLLGEEDLLRQSPDQEALSHFPDEMSQGRLSFPLRYKFDPGAPEDGVTLRIPHGLTAAVRAECADWLVPGLLKEKISALVRGLPKEYRKRLVPIPATIDTILREMPRGEAPLASALTDFIYRRFEVEIPARTWPVESLPDHLRLRLSVVDDRGREIRGGRDIGALQREISVESESHAFERAAKKWARKGVVSWDFGDLPESVLLTGRGGPEGLAYPALVVGSDQLEKDEAAGVELRLFRDRHRAESEHLRGGRALFAIHFRKELKHLKKQMALTGDMKVWAGYFGGEAIERDILERVMRKLFPVAVRTEQEFRSRIEAVSGTILLTGVQEMQEIAPVLKACAEMRQWLARFEVANRSGKAAGEFIAEIRRQLNRFLPKGFIAQYDPERLSQIPRYLKALRIRAERGILHLEKDREKAAQVKSYEDRLDELKAELAPESSPEKRKAVADFGWMVDEFRVAVFAQDVRTVFPVSVKRLDEKLRQIDRIL